MVFAYLRVSSAGQCDGDGFARQLEAVSPHKPDRVFREEGVSGTLLDRPVLGELLATVSAGDCVIVEKLDRLARDIVVQETILRDLERRGVRFISASEPDMSGADPSRVLIRQIFGAVAQYDKAMIVLKLRAARQRIKAATGRCEGRKPYPDAVRLRDLRAEGKTYAQIGELVGMSARSVQRIVRRLA